MWLRDCLRLSSLRLARSLSGSKEAAETNIYSHAKGFKSFCKWSVVGSLLSSRERQKARGWTLRHIKQKRRCGAMGIDASSSTYREVSLVRGGRSTHNCASKAEVQQTPNWGTQPSAGVGRAEVTPQTRKAYARRGRRALVGEEMRLQHRDLTGCPAREGCVQWLPGRPSKQRQGAVRSSQVHLNCHSVPQPQSLSCVQRAFPFFKKSQKQHL